MTAKVTVSILHTNQKLSHGQGSVRPACAAAARRVVIRPSLRLASKFNVWLTIQNISPQVEP